VAVTRHGEDGFPQVVQDDAKILIQGSLEAHNSRVLGSVRPVPSIMTPWET
jgi:hypothetical protein